MPHIGHTRASGVAYQAPSPPSQISLKDFLNRVSKISREKVTRVDLLAILETNLHSRLSD